MVGFSPYHVVSVGNPPRKPWSGVSTLNSRGSMGRTGRPGSDIEARALAVGGAIAEQPPTDTLDRSFRLDFGFCISSSSFHLGRDPFIFLPLLFLVISSSSFRLLLSTTTAHDLGQRSPALLVGQLHLAKVLIQVQDDLESVAAAAIRTSVQADLGSRLQTSGDLLGL